MKKLLIAASALLLFSCSKTETSTQTQTATPEKETVYVEKPVDEITADNVTDPIPPVDSEYENQEGGTEYPENNGLKDLSGKHSLTLQWISWERPGSIQFKKIGENRYQVSGSQKRGNDYLKVEGEITQISDINLEFEGTIETNIAANGGKCLRTGLQTFLVTQNRKYWRLQNMVECFGLTDYVDIYF